MLHLKQKETFLKILSRFGRVTSYDFRIIIVFIQNTVIFFYCSFRTFLGLSKKTQGLKPLKGEDRQNLSIRTNISPVEYLDPCNANLRHICNDPVFLLLLVAV